MEEGLECAATSPVLNPSESAEESLDNTTASLLDRDWGGIARPYYCSSRPLHTSLEALGGKHSSCQPVCRQAEEEEEKPSCGTPQPAAAPTMAGENGQSPPHTRVAVNSLQIFQADKELQSAAENGRASRRYRDHGEGGSGVFCVLLQLYPNSRPLS